MKNYKEVNQEFYSSLFAQYGNDVKSLGYGKERSQKVRFEQFIKNFDFNSASVLDIGCGFADFYKYMREKNVNPAKYIGVDMLKENIDAAQKVYQLNEDCSLIHADFFEHEFTEKVDYCVLSGIFNLEYNDWADVSKKVLFKMWNLSEKGIVFNIENIYGMDEARKKQITVQNYDPLFWLKFVFDNFNHKVVFSSHYHDSDFTIGVFK